jgi:hypothetical protein
MANPNPDAALPLAVYARAPSENRYHTYRLSFLGEAALTLETDTHRGVDAETGRLLERISGVRIQGFA